jgi:hypothetical protein
MISEKAFKKLKNLSIKTIYSGYGKAFEFDIIKNIKL